MCQEFHCECCPDDLPQIDCVCEGCFHDNESATRIAVNKGQDNKPDLTKDKTVPKDENGEKGDSCNQDSDVKEESSCCKGENSGQNSCCVESCSARRIPGEEVAGENSCCSTQGNPCETTSSCGEVKEPEKKPCCSSKNGSCCGTEEETPKTCTGGEEAATEKSCCSSQGKPCETTSGCAEDPEKKPCCSSGKPCCDAENTEEKTPKTGKDEIASEKSCCSSQGKPCETTSSCAEVKEPEKKPCCGSENKQEKNPKTGKVATDNSCCSSQEKPCETTSSCADVEDPEKKPCCSSKNGSSCGAENKQQKEEKPDLGCCSLTSDKEAESAPKSSKTIPRKQDTDGKLEEIIEPSRETCCSDKNDQCCEKENEGECKSTEVEVSCCKVNEETVLLIEPSEEQTAPQSSGTVKTKGTLPRRHTTKLRVQNICCAMEAQLVQECLNPLEGVENVAVNVIGRVVHVRHDPDVTSPTELVDSLNKVHLGATVMEMGAHHDKDNDKIPFLLKLGCIYLLIQTFLLIIAVAGLFLKQPWHMWVAITEIIFGGAPILKHAVISAKNRKIDINILMLIAIIGTLAISEWVEGATVVYVFAFADALQEFCMFRVQRTISRLMLKRPEIAVLVETGESVPIESVVIGTLIAVRPGELIPLDGVVVKGKAAVDESSITGESLPVEKTVFSKVYSGTVNQNGYIEVETTSDSSNSTVSKVAQMVQEAQSSSTKTEAIINRFAKYYTPLVVLVAALVVVVPAILGAAGVGNYLEEIREWGRRALVMLVIACPCALVMATPIAVVCSITAAARKGALVKGGEHLETLSKIKVLAFDKTGTLTEGKFQVMNMECVYGENERDVLRLAAGLESKSVHPIAAAIVNEFSGCVAEMVKNQIITLPEVTQFKMYEGQGISGLIEGKLVRVGNKEMVDQCGASLTETMAEKYKLWSSESKTVVFVCVDERLCLMIALADAIRPNTSTSLDWLRNIGVQTSMITGDNSRTAEAVSRNLGLDECVSEMKPHEKLEWIQQKQKSKMSPDSASPRDDKCKSCKCCIRSRDQDLMVGMVGDGVNDGPALAAANVGIAMGAGGTALAVEAADVALMSNNLAKIPELICLANFCSLIVKQNIVFSVVLKIVIVIVALSGYVTLWMAVVADVFGLLFVIVNGLRPLMWKASKTHTKGNVDIELSPKKRGKDAFKVNDLKTREVKVNKVIFVKSTNQLRTSCERQQSCRSSQQLTPSESAGMERGQGKEEMASENSCCSKSEASCSPDQGEGQSTKEKSRAACCTDTNNECCETKPNEGECRSTKVEASCCKDNEETMLLPEPCEEKSRAACCTDTNDECCEKKPTKGECRSTKVEASCCKDNEETKLLTEPCEEKSRSTCCSDTKDKCCEMKPTKGECRSTKVEASCCKDNEETKLLPEPCEEKSRATCCSDTKDKCCEMKPNIEKCRSTKVEASCCKDNEETKLLTEPCEEKSRATCCSDTKDKCCEMKPNIEKYGSTKVEASCCKDNGETMLLPEPSEEKSRATCCTDTNDKCCEKKTNDKCCETKQNKAECGSTKVEASCCKDNGETVLLIEPNEERCCSDKKDKCCEKEDDRECGSTKGKASCSNKSQVVKAKGTLPRRHITKLRVQNICCGLEAQLVQECLKPLEGVENVAIDVIGRVVLVRHDPDVSPPAKLVESLNQVHLGASVMEMGAHHDKDDDKIPLFLKIGFIYVFLQTFLFITAVAGFFLKQPWYMWVAITEIIVGGAPILKRSFFAVKKRKIDINILMIIAMIGTMALSKWIEGATVVYAFAFAHALQEFCMFRVQRTISRLVLKRPEVAVLVETGESVPIESVAIGTLIAVRPGELIPLDGVVVKGKAAVDESSITGESLPVEKTVSSKIYSGTVNQNGYIEVETTSDSSNSTVWKIAQMVQEAQSSSTKIEAIINRFAKYYTPLVVAVAALVVVVPAILGAAGVGTYLEEMREWGRRALVMLIIACPCALVMSTPIAVVCSITAAARKGALVKGGEHLETLSKIKAFAFDKTGTLTEGKFQVMNMECVYGENERDVLRLAAGLESKSVHPIAAAIVNKFSGCVTEMVRNQIITLPQVTQFKMYEGQGISGLIEGKLVRVGNKKMVDQCGASLTETMAEKYKLWSSESKTVVLVCVDERLCLMIALADSIRHTTSVSLYWLRNMGVQTSMITGDNSRTAEAVSRNLGLDECVSEMKPHEKLEWIQQKQKSNIVPSSNASRDIWHRSRDQDLMVGMVGDGVNDGPALAAANVGIAMGAGGTALAVEAADVALMSNDLAKIPELICLAKFCSLIVKQNIVFSVVLKIATVIVALCGYLDLWMAVIADVMGLLFVIVNGLRPLIWKASQKHTNGNKDIEANGKNHPFSYYRKSIKIPIPNLKSIKKSWKIEFPQYGSSTRARASSNP